MSRGLATIPKRFARAAMLALGALIASPPISAARTPLVAVDGAYVSDGRGARVTFAVSGQVEPRVLVLDEPNRVVIDLPEINFQFAPGLGRDARGLVKALRYGLFAPGRSRIVIDLAAPAVVESVKVEAKLAEGPFFVTVELARVEQPVFSKAAAASRALLAVDRAPAAEAVEAPGDTALPLVVIDPGHGGIDPGTTTKTGQLEKDLVFAFAKRLRDRLAAGGQVRAVLTRDDDVFVALADRVRFARERKAALFISLHADALAGPEKVSGATVYTASRGASDREAQRVAEKENRSDEIAGVEAVEKPEDAVADILFELARRETRVVSHRFAKTLVGGLGGAMPMNKNPMRSAGFRVLGAPDVPSVLLELGYLSTPEDSERIGSTAWQDKAAAALAESLTRFLTRRSVGEGP